MGYLIHNRAADGDYPTSGVIYLYSTLMAYLEKTADDGTDAHWRIALIKEYMTCLYSLQKEVRSSTFYPFLFWANITTHILSNICTALIVCSEERVIGADDFTVKAFLVLP